MKILYLHQYFTFPTGSCGNRPYAFAKKLVNDGHDVKIVCLNYDASDTGLKKPFINGKRSGKIEGIEIIEFNLNPEELANLKSAAESVKQKVLELNNLKTQ